MEIGAEADLTESFESTARVAVIAGEVALGSRWLAAADAMRERLAFARRPVDAERDATLRAQLPVAEAPAIGDVAADALAFLDAH